MQAKGWLRWTLFALLALIAVNALLAGPAFMLDPSGRGIGIPQEWLEDSPFEDYFVPGLLLTGLGLLHAFAAWRQWKGTRDAWFWAGLAAGGLVVWIVVQALMMGSTRHPIQTFLQAFCLLAGAATGLLALAQRRQRREAPVP